MSGAAVSVSGQIVRVPAAIEAIERVTLAGGAATVTDTATSFGSFNVTIPLKLDSQLEFVANDNPGSTSSRIGIVVVHPSAR